MEYLHRCFVAPPHGWRQVLLSPVSKLNQSRFEGVEFTNTPVNTLLTTKDPSDDKPDSGYNSLTILNYFMPYVTNLYYSRNYVSTNF